MAKSKETFGKKEKEKQRLKKRRDKEEKMEERRANATKGKSLDDMLAFVDENGNISSTPPDRTRLREINLEDIQLGAAPVERDQEDAVRTGVLESFNNDKGYGFIRDAKTRESIFVHINNITGEINKGTQVSYELEQTPKGVAAINVKAQI
jgi:cold shock CspA family protein